MPFSTFPCDSRGPSCSRIWHANNVNNEVVWTSRLGTAGDEKTQEGRTYAKAARLRVQTSSHGNKDSDSHSKKNNF